MNRKREMKDPCKVLRSLSTAFLSSPDRILTAAIQAQEDLRERGDDVGPLTFFIDGTTRSLPGGRGEYVEIHNLRDAAKSHLLQDDLKKGVRLILPEPGVDVSGRSLAKHAAHLVEKRFSELEKNRINRIAVWGVGYYGRVIMGELSLPSHVDLCAAVDNNPKTHGTTFRGVTVRGVETLDESVFDLVIVCIAGHRESLQKCKSEMKKRHPFFSPLEDVPPSSPEIHDRTGWLDLRDLTLLCNPGDGFLSVLQEKLVQVWEAEIKDDIHSLGDTISKVEHLEGDPYFRCMDHLNTLSENLSAHIQFMHPTISRGLGKCIGVSGWQSQCLIDVAESFSGKTVLDIGFGPSLLNAMLMHVDGASRVISIDPFSIPEECEGWIGYALPIFAYLFGENNGTEKKAHAFEVFSKLIRGIDFQTQRIDLDPEKIDVRYCGLETLDLPSGSVDLAFSYAVFEHVEDCVKSFHNLFRLMKPGARAFHFVDYTPHGTPDDSHLSPYFKSRDDKSPNPYGVFINRLRTPDFMRLFEDAGFVVEKYVPGSSAPCEQADYDRIHPTYKDVDSMALAEMTAFFCLKKP